MTTPFLIEALSKQDRQTFRCGEEDLDRYFQQQVTQDMRRRVASCYVVLDRSSREVAGYYTLSACHVALNDLPKPLQRKLPRYPSVPAVRLGRLAVSLSYQGHGLGSALLVNAAARVLRSDIAAYALIVDAKHDRATSFYLHHGFIPFSDSPSRLFAPIAALSKALGIE